jgi:hypothetical protein
VGEENPEQRSRRKSLDVQERTKHSPFSNVRIFSLAACFVLRHHCSSRQQLSKSDSDKDASREQIRQEWKTIFSYEFSSASSGNN